MIREMAKTKFHRERRTPAFFKTFARLLEEYRVANEQDWIDSPILMKLFNQACAAVGGEPIVDNGFVENGRVCQNFYAALAITKENLRILGADSYLLIEGNRNETGGFNFVLEYDNFIKYIDSIGDTALKIKAARKGTSSSKKKKPSTAKKEPQVIAPVVEEKPVVTKKRDHAKKDTSFDKKRVPLRRELRMALYAGALVNHLGSQADYGAIAKILGNNDYCCFKEFDRPRDEQLAFQFWSKAPGSLGNYFKLEGDIVTFQEGWDYPRLLETYMCCTDRTEVFCVLPISKAAQELCKSKYVNVNGSKVFPDNGIIALTIVLPNHLPNTLRDVSKYRDVLKDAVCVKNKLNFILPEDYDDEIDEKQLINLYLGLSTNISERTLNNKILFDAMSM